MNNILHNRKMNSSIIPRIQNLFSINKSYFIRKESLSDVDEGMVTLNIDNDTVPDEEFQKTAIKKTDKKASWPLKLENGDFMAEGPNINIKLPKRSYSSKEERKYFINKIKIKKKTEVHP
jgi:hypothetical protein